MTERKIVQIAISSGSLFALADDGTLWTRNGSSVYHPTTGDFVAWAEWQQLQVSLHTIDELLVAHPEKASVESPLTSSSPATDGSQT